jgi:hypothetical protein
MCDTFVTQWQQDTVTDVRHIRHTVVAGYSHGCVTHSSHSGGRIQSRVCDTFVTQWRQDTVTGALDILSIFTWDGRGGPVSSSCLAH